MKEYFDGFEWRRMFYDFNCVYREGVTFVHLNWLLHRARFCTLVTGFLIEGANFFILKGQIIGLMFLLLSTATSFWLLSQRYRLDIS